MPKARATKSAQLRRMLPDEPDPAAPLVGALLRFSLQHVLDRILAALARAGFDELGDAHLKVMRFPPPDGERPSVLAKRAKMTKQAMNYLLVQLEELGYIARRAKPGTTTRLVYLTRRGWKVGALQRKTVRTVEAEWAKKVGVARFAAFMSVLREIAGP